MLDTTPSGYTSFLQGMIDAVERIKRDYPDVPVRFEFAPDVYEALERQCAARHDSVTNVLTGIAYSPGVVCVVDPTSGPGEWGPVFRCKIR